MLRQKVVRERIKSTLVFFVTGRIQKGGISVEWCQTNDMTGDFFTKPNQGSLFRRFTYMIMGGVLQPELGLENPKNTH